MKSSKVKKPKKKRRYHRPFDAGPGATARTTRRRRRHRGHRAVTEHGDTADRTVETSFDKNRAVQGRNVRHEDGGELTCLVEINFERVVRDIERLVVACHRVVEFERFHASSYALHRATVWYIDDKVSDFTPARRKSISKRICNRHVASTGRHRCLYTCLVQATLTTSSPVTRQ